MKKDFTRTRLNLASAYLAESVSFSRYTFYAKQAESELYFPISQLFTDTAANELHHAKVFFKLLAEGGSMVIPEVSLADPMIGHTAQNLEIAAHGEHHVGVETYLRYAEAAAADGFDDVACVLRSIAEVEALHERRFLAYLDQVRRGMVWRRSEPITWQCAVCGYHHRGIMPPDACPACNHPHQHFLALDLTI
jgi:rubrerythrin